MSGGQTIHREEGRRRSEQAPAGRRAPGSMTLQGGCQLYNRWLSAPFGATGARDRGAGRLFVELDADFGIRAPAPDHRRPVGSDCRRDWLLARPRFSVAMPSASSIEVPPTRNTDDRIGRTGEGRLKCGRNVGREPAVARDRAQVARPRSVAPGVSLLCHRGSDATPHARPRAIGAENSMRPRRRMSKGAGRLISRSLFRPVAGRRWPLAGSRRLPGSATH
jgi:hypothetical protein